MTVVSFPQLGGVEEWVGAVTTRADAGQRFAGLVGTQTPLGLRLSALFAATGRFDIVETLLDPRHGSYPSLTAAVPGALWYEREIHDLFGVPATGRPRLDPLVLPLSDEASERPRPGAADRPDRLDPDPAALPAHVAGEGVFTIPYGPVRSGVFESVEYLTEGPGEDIQHVRVRVHGKHRGVEKRFEELDVDTGVLLAERVEGVASVAHAIAYAEAVERLAGVSAPVAARLVRSLFAELERISNHLHSVIGLCEAAGLVVAVARFGYHKERVMRLLAALSGSRFGRGSVLPGGVRALPALDAEATLRQLVRLARAIESDARVLMRTPSFLDRLRGTGPIPHELARRHGALGPIARASGCPEDVRASRPYAGYDRLGEPTAQAVPTADVLGRARQRWAEVRESFRLARAAVDELDERADPAAQLCAVVPPDLSGRAVGWAEAPQGEVCYLLDVEDGRIRRCKPRSASFHNLALFGRSFAGDITTDFAFIEASFGLSVAGVAG